jgi:hypothetical protein
VVVPLELEIPFYGLLSMKTMYHSVDPDILDAAFSWPIWHGISIMEAG